MKSTHFSAQISDDHEGSDIRSCASRETSHYTPISIITTLSILTILANLFMGTDDVLRENHTERTLSASGYD